LFAVFNNQILEVTEDTPFIAQITFSFNEGGENREKSQTTQFILHNRNAMTWEDQEKIASFVTAKDPAIRFFARAVLQMFKGEEVSYIHNNLLTAMQVFDAIGAYGVRYVEDPVTPYAKISETKDVIDYIQYPIDTLRVKSGDCDDDVVLYTTLLESIGIQTALVDFPGHVVAMFNTGVTVEKAHLVNPNRNQLIIYENNIWVPVEVTMFGKTFAEAWYSAANRFNTTPEEKRKIIKISRAWDKYPPVTLLSSDWEPTIPDKKKISELLDLEIKTQYNARKKYIEEKYNEYFKISPVDYRGYNVLGIIYGEHMLYRDAIEYFEKAIKLKPDYLDAHINLGYAYYKNKQFDESLSQLLEAIKYEPDNANLNYNIGIIYAEKRNFDVAIKYLKIASVLDENYRKSYEYLASAVGGGRAGSVSSLEMDIKWRD
jgi:tetratricopeptide (TPR) repeat protein